MIDISAFRHAPHRVRGCPEPYAVQGAIPNQSGHEARMMVPFPTADSMSKDPPDSSARSFMVLSPIALLNPLLSVQQSPAWVHDFRRAKQKRTYYFS